ncbi:transcriptional regulator [Flavobacterium granuli]|uniref:Transcriptional regulator n=1 Tax=Flavobacterium granuli TaxID=280093 RepID=A0ABU1RX81_9FLAO|nr:transcriptional regulator [Flavobacterium granuli]MDR6843368.1 hypothetical protein [Flavobacterium granuli]
MNYIKHLTGFFDKIIQDPNLNPTHISLYMALFQFWNVNRFKNPISITREEVMHISKICSKATYHKCMRELNEKKYIKYMPSFNPFKGSMVVLFNFSEDPKPVQKRDSNTKKNIPKTEQVLNRQETSSKTGIEQALVPSINYINNLNISNLDEPSQNFKMHVAFSSYEKDKIEKERHINNLDNPAKKEKIKPTFDEIKTHFEKQKFPELEAQKFFNYFSSNGWLVGGKTPMADWTAAAQNWMLNANKFSTTTKPNRAKHLTTKTDKNYSEPL